MIPDDSYKGILDRKESASYVKNYFQETINLLREIVDYGTRLIPRCYTTTPKKDLTAAVILGILVKNSVATLDAIEILVSQGALLTANLQARGLFETYLYIHWIFKEDTDRRVKQYYVWHLRKELTWTRRSIIGSPEQKAFFNKVSEFSDSLLEKIKNEQDEIKELKTHLEELINCDDYKCISNEFDNIKSKKIDHDLDWFRPWGPKNRFQMAKELGFESQYTIFYDMYSRIMHANVTQDHVKYNDGTITFLPIRQLEGIDTLLQPVIMYILSIYSVVISYFRPGEKENFARKYKSEWKERYLSILKVKYNVTKEVIC